MQSAILKIIVTIYTLLIFWLGMEAANDSASLNYPGVLVAWTVASYFSLCTGMLALTYRWHPAFIRNYWRPVYILCVAELLVGIFMDATIPTDYSIYTDGLDWVISSAIVTVLLAPALFLNYVLAFSKRRGIE